MQAIKGYGLNWLSFDLRLLSLYDQGDQIELFFTRKNCEFVNFLAKDISECENNILIEFEVNKCFDPEGKWLLELKNNSKGGEIIFKTFVQIYNTNHVQNT